MVDWLKQRFQRVQDFLQSILEGIRSSFNGIIQFFVGIWDWFVLTCDLYFVFLKENYEATYEVITSSIRTTAEWVVEQVKFLGKWGMEQILYWADCALKAFVRFIEWLLEQFPEMQLPPDFQEGLGWLIKFGMFLDTVLPVRETLGLIVLYLTIVIFIGICRLIYKAFQLIPFV